jgi:hypothetical protein
MPLPMTYYACSFKQARSRLLVLGKVDRLPGNANFSWLVGYEEPAGFTGFDLNGINCTTLLAGSAKNYYVGERGEVWAFLPTQQRTIAQLPDAGITGRALGQPNHIREIAGRVYICGYAGQVYVETDAGQWVHMDDGLVEAEATPASLDLESIDGTAPDDIYVVGSKGRIFHWNGRQWSQVQALTNVYLARVRCFRRDSIVVVGDKGVFIESDGRNWKVSQIPGADDGGLWDVEVFEGDLYVTALSKIYRRRGGVWDEVRHGIPEDPKTDFLRLAVGNGRLWVMGSKRLFSYDGSNWRTHIDPNNG